MNAKHTPSDDARALLHYASNARANVADNEADAAYCLACARAWAAHIIAGPKKVDA
jgi:hypothetical protein